MKDFRRWFRRQFGAVPLMSKEADTLRDELFELRSRMTEVETQLNCDSIIRAQWTAARYAIQARRKP